MVNFVNLASDSQVPPSTVREYYAILKDTFIAHELPAFAETAKRKAITTAKYYLFDIGLARHLQGRTGLAPGTPEYGSAFESYVFHQGILRTLAANAALLALQVRRGWTSSSSGLPEGQGVVGARDLRGRGRCGKRACSSILQWNPARLVDEHPAVDFIDELWDGALAG